MKEIIQDIYILVHLIEQTTSSFQSIN